MSGGKLRYISLFAGIGGFDLGFDRAGMECAAQVENDEFCLSVLEKHWPNTLRIKDIRDANRINLPPVDVICGGFPCQDVSVAGKRLGLRGERSTLWDEFYRIICEIRPRWVVVENTMGLLSSDEGEFFAKILREISQARYDAEWHTLSACAFGAPHTRERVFIVAYPAGHRLKGNVRQVVSQEVYDLSLEALDSWHGTGNPFENHAVLMGTPGVCVLPDGVPSTVAIRPALRGYGNAVVPQIAEFIGRCIIAQEA